MAQPLFKTKPVPIDTLSEFLAVSRQKLNLDLKTVSLLTQIKPAYLEHLETGSWNKLPSEVYIKGFLRQLAVVYAVAESDLIGQFEKERGLGISTLVLEDRRVRSTVYINPRKLFVAAGLVLTLIVIGYIISQIRSVLAPPLLEITDPAEDANVSGESLIVAGRTETGADVSINNQIVSVDKNGAFTEPLIVSPGLNVIEIKSVNKFGKESKIIRQISAVVERPDLPVGNAVNLTIEIGPESAWIYLEVDGTVVYRGTMLAGSSKSISAQEHILLTTANAGSTAVIYNGQDLGVLGRSGEVIRNVEFAAATR